MAATVVVIEVVLTIEEYDDVFCDVVEIEFAEVRVCRFSVIVPGPAITTIVGLFVPEHTIPPMQLQLENT